MGDEYFKSGNGLREPWVAWCFSGLKVATPSRLSAGAQGTLCHRHPFQLARPSCSWERVLAVGLPVGAGGPMRASGGSLWAEVGKHLPDGTGLLGTGWGFLAASTFEAIPAPPRQQLETPVAKAAPPGWGAGRWEPVAGGGPAPGPGTRAAQEDRDEAPGPCRWGMRASAEVVSLASTLWL